MEKENKKNENAEENKKGKSKIDSFLLKFWGTATLIFIWIFASAIFSLGSYLHSSINVDPVSGELAFLELAIFFIPLIISVWFNPILFWLCLFLGLAFCAMIA